jgi:hypothetical protein
MGGTEINLPIPKCDLLTSIAIKPAGDNKITLDIDGTGKLDSALPGLKELDGRPSGVIWDKLPANARDSIRQTVKTQSRFFQQHGDSEDAKRTIALAADLIEHANQDGGKGLNVNIATPESIVISKEG